MSTARSLGIVARRLAPLLAGVGLVLAGCKGEPRPAAIGAEPREPFIVGPQPGPNRAFATVSNPYAGDNQVLADGRRIFVWMNCAGCHGDHGGGGMGPSLRDSVWIYGGNAEDIFASITEGRANGMPSWGTKMPRDQIWRVVTYIQSMRTPVEPDAPR